MTVFSTNTPRHDAAGNRNVFAAAWAAVQAWNDNRQTRNALMALTDRELADIGLVRADLDRFPIKRAR